MGPLIYASSNSGKIQEARQLSQDLGLELEILTAKLPPTVEDGTTYAANAWKKARAYQERYSASIIADDGGLELWDYPGLLGLQTQRFFPKGLNDEEKNQKILDLLNHNPKAKRGATLHATVVYLDEETSQSLVVSRQQDFLIASQAEAGGGYGFDPILWVEELGQTTAALAEADRKHYSPRYQALKALFEQIKELNHDQYL